MFIKEVKHQILRVPSRENIGHWMKLSNAEDLHRMTVFMEEFGICALFCFVQKTMISLTPYSVC